jgi:copper chaperone CopZ
MARLLIAISVCFVAFLSGCAQQPGDSGSSHREAVPTTETRKFAIDGMRCEGCVNTITSAVKVVPGVQSVEVSLNDKEATVVGDTTVLRSGTIEKTISDAGYKAKLIEKDRSS